MAPDTRSFLKRILIKAGVAGIKQSDITYAMRNKAWASEFLPILEQWRKDNAVQKFRIDSQVHRPGIVWRATEEILNVK